MKTFLIFILFLFTQLIAQNNELVADKHPNEKTLIGGYLGVGYGVLTGNISNYFNNTFRVPITGDLMYKKFLVQLNLDAGFSKVSKTMLFNDNTSWNEGEKAFHNSIGINFGYSFFFDEKIIITLFAGYAYSYISKDWWGTSDIAQNEPGYNSSNLGVLFDFATLLSSVKDGDSNFSRLRISIGIYSPIGNNLSQTNYYDGSSIYITVGVVNLSVL